MWECHEIIDNLKEEAQYNLKSYPGSSNLSQTLPVVPLPIKGSNTKFRRFRSLKNR